MDVLLPHARVEGLNPAISILVCVFLGSGRCLVVGALQRPTPTFLVNGTACLLFQKTSTGTIYLHAKYSSQEIYRPMWFSRKADLSIHSSSNNEMHLSARTNNGRYPVEDKYRSGPLPFTFHVLSLGASSINDICCIWMIRSSNHVQKLKGGTISFSCPFTFVILCTLLEKVPSTHQETRMHPFPSKTLAVTCKLSIHVCCLSNVKQPCKHCTCLLVVNNIPISAA